MKYLSHYTEQAQTDVFTQYGAFFAFSQKQMDEQKKDGVIYVSVGAGLIAPKSNAANLVLALENIQQAGMNADVAENGIKAIIHRELGNHECQIVGNYDDALDVLEPYGITEDQVKAEWREFWNICVENDYF